MIQLDRRSAAAYSALGLVEHLQSHHQEAIAHYHEALSIAPGDPVTCDLLRIVLDDTTTCISHGVIDFPGIPRQTMRSIDDRVRELDDEILQGAQPVFAPTDDEGEDGTGEVDMGEETVDEHDEGELSRGMDESSMDLGG